MVEQEVLEELKIVEDVSHSLNVYALDELITEDEINEALGIMSGLCQKYRHIHVELKSKVGDVYNERYPKYNVTVNKLIAFIKSAKNMIRILNKDIDLNKKNNDDKTLSLKENQEKEMLKSKEEFFNLKITQINDCRYFCYYKYSGN